MQMVKNIALSLVFICSLPTYAEKVPLHKATREEMKECGDKLANAEWNATVGEKTLIIICAIVISALQEKLEASLATSWTKYLLFWSGVNIAAAISLFKGIEFFDRTPCSLRETYKKAHTDNDYKLIKSKAALTLEVWEIDAVFNILALTILSLPFVALVAMDNVTRTPPNLIFL